MRSSNSTAYNIVITGGSAGIGYATAKRLLRDGHKIFLCARNLGNLKRALTKLEECVGSSGLVSGMQCDIGDPEQAQLMINSAAEFLGGIDVLINNAGVGKIASIEDITIAEWQNMIRTNVSGVFYCCKAAIPYLINSENAQIVNLGSRAGRYAFAGGTAYCATKSAMQGFTEALFLDLEPYSVGVTLIAPGTVATNFADVEKQEWQIQPDDVAKVISDTLASHKRANINWVEIRPRTKQIRKI
ncbi:SDR family NAD(P)-dependent oxidoreductase [Sneathiella glossodoripedis]|uniref:SDR family NAD(P)-dependent oxidoreductase n=1 Tax=Sneathiella glossodoripedis TaxID=418853 RepID=UPI00046F2901|nr:SDR family NAD(P)-dependent oxidoreductase [Sneathiella glossodoripedis]